MMRLIRQYRTPIRGTLRCARYCIPAAQTPPQTDGHLHILIFSTSKHTAQEEVLNSERPSPSPQLPTYEIAHDTEKSSPGPHHSPCEEAQHSVETPSLGPQPPTHEEAHSSEKSSHGSQPPTHEQEQHDSAKGPPITKRNAGSVRANWKREERERMKQEKQERRRLENERRLEGQRQEYERKIEARRKAEEAAAVARAQSKGEELSTNQKVHNDDDAATVGAPGPRVLERDAGATCLAITNNKHHKSHLIMMADVSCSYFFLLFALGYDGNEKTDYQLNLSSWLCVRMSDIQSSTMSFTTLLPPITSCDPSDSASSALGYCYYDKGDVTHQCQYWCQCGIVHEDLREDSQTRMESNYLFEPPPLRLPSPKPIESVQTRQDATDVLFQSSLEQSGDSAGTAVVVTVVIPKVKTELKTAYLQLETRRTTSKEVDAPLDEVVTGDAVRGEETVDDVLRTKSN